MSEFFQDNAPNSAYLRSAAQIYEKIDTVFALKGTPYSYDRWVALQTVTLNEEELGFARDVFQVKKLGEVDSFEITSLTDELSIDDVLKTSYQTKAALITIVDGPVITTFYLRKTDDAKAILYFHKEITKNDDYQTTNLEPIEPISQNDEPHNVEKIFGSFADMDDAINVVSLDEQHAIESILDYLAISSW